MTYVAGFVPAVPEGKRQADVDLANQGIALLREFGAQRQVEAWDDDVQDGELADFRRAVKAMPDEAVIFSWFEWPSRAVRDAAWQTIFTDPRMQEGNPPQHESRCISGGFLPVMDA